LAFLLCGLAGPAAAASKYSAQELFERFRDAIVQVQITNALSGERAGFGTGFYVAREGLLVTNYHVVSAVVQKPDTYRVELVGVDGTKVRPEIVNFDLVNDLALLRVAKGPANPFTLSTASLRKGEPISSLGNPNDLGMTVVNGSYSGALENSLHDRIHFSGAINPGMSGGPAVDVHGKVVGINVATSGNGVGFLVPAKFAAQLVERANQAKPAAMDNVRQQLFANQERFMGELLARDLPISPLGPYRMPDKIAPFMHCWGDSDKDPKKLHEVVSRGCSSQQDVMIDDDYSTGLVYYTHRYLHSTTLNPLRFSALHSAFFAAELDGDGGEDYHTNFRCSEDFVDNGSVNLKTVLCLRGHKKVKGLFDVGLVAASLQDTHSGVQTTLTLTGVSYENGMKFVDKYLKSIAWKK
jgi:hypothetical protein